MTNRKPRNDPEKRAAKRKRHRKALEKGIKHLPKADRPSQSQMTHASSSRANKKRREGEERLQRERDSATNPQSP